MAVNFTSPVTGGAQTGFTSPTYTLTADQAPTNASKQWAVTALGGTQAGVTAHAASNPFTVTVFKPTVMRLASVPNPVTGVISSAPINSYRILVRKGARPGANQNPVVDSVDMKINVAAGTDLYDSAEVRAMVSFAAGLLNQQPAGIGDTAVGGIL